jgi:hypothetical protein
MAKRILLTGGVLRENGFELGEGKYYGCAKLLALDVETGATEHLLSISEGNANFPDVHPNLEFTAGAVEGDRLWLPTDTEIRCYSYPALQLERVYSHPCFHNVHSVAVRGDELWVTSTGLDHVVVLSKEDGSVRRIVNAEGKPAWHRFSAEEDYRKVHSTRPHDCHPNYVFWLEDRAWVTRCTQEDAVLLDDPTQRIEVSGSHRPISVHDGHVEDGRIYFTTVDGCIMIADAGERRVVEELQLSTLDGFGGLRGWCRGLYIEGDLCYVGFSRLRKTKRVERLHWVGKLLQRGTPVEECSVLAIDLRRRRIVRDYRLPVGSMDAIYGVLPEPQVTTNRA